MERLGRRRARPGHNPIHEGSRTMSDAKGDPLAEFPVVIEVPVWWGDMDAFQHVNNTVFLRWFESARIAYTTRLGLPELYRTRKIGPILASVTCHFRRQVQFPDTVRVGARIERIGRTSLTMTHAVASQALGAVAAEGTSAIVVFDYRAGRPFPVPDDLRASIEALEGRPLGEGPKSQDRDVGVE
jgi:acyl-CoA thioester hydrolase